MSTCRVALIGAGSNAQDHARAFADIEGVELVGVHSRTHDRAARLADDLGFQRTYALLEELLQDAAPDLVVVAVSVESMYEVAIRCMASSATLLLEKPPGLDLKQAERLLTLSEGRDSEVLVALNRRFYSSTQTVARGVEAAHGDRLIFVSDQQDRAEAAALGLAPEVIDNWMFANSIHLIDYLSFFGRGDVEAINHTALWNPSSPGLVACGIEFSSGDRGLYRCVWDRPGSWGVTVATLDSEWELKPLEKGQVRGRDRGVVPIEPAPRDLAFKAGFRSQAQEAVNAANAQPSRSVTLAEAVKTMRLAARIYSI